MLSEEERYPWLTPEVEEIISNLRNAGASIDLVAIDRLVNTPTLELRGLEHIVDTLPTR